MIRTIQRISFLQAILILFCLFAYFTNTSIISAQESVANFDEAFNEYNLTLGEYRETHRNYVLKRAQHLKFSTLNSKTEAEKATYDILSKRDEVIIKYLSALHERVLEAEGLSQTDIDSLQLKINDEIVWYENHKESLSTASTLDDFVEDSALAKQRYIKKSKSLFYEILATISYGRISDFNERSLSLLTNVKDKLEKIRKDEREEYKLNPEQENVIDRWLFESESRVLRGEVKKQEALTLINEFYKSRKDKVQDKYLKTMTILGESQLIFKETSSNLLEVVKAIKTTQ